MIVKRQSKKSYLKESADFEKSSFLYRDSDWEDFADFVESVASATDYKILLPAGSNLNKEAKDGNFIVLKDDEGNLHLLFNDSNVDSIGYCFVNSNDGYVKAYGWEWFDDLDELYHQLLNK